MRASRHVLVLIIIERCRDVMFVYRRLLFSLFCACVFLFKRGSLNGSGLEDAKDTVLLRKSADLECLNDGGPSVCRPLCGGGMFSLNGMPTCQPWLDCDAIGQDVDIVGEIGTGAVKIVSLGLWKMHAVAVSTPVTTTDGRIIFDQDFRSGLCSRIELGPSVHLVQLVGYCMDPSIIVTEYHPLGGAAGAPARVGSDGRQRFSLCLDYAEILAWLHSRPSGPRVMCDSSDLYKTLEQYLVANDLRLVLNDLDALPVANRTVKCGHRQLTGDFVAPEQRWPHADRDYDDDIMLPYDEATDVWKIPDVCHHFLYGSTDEDLLSFHLFDIHQRCKATNALLRPKAWEVLQAYSAIWQSLYS